MKSSRYNTLCSFRNSQFPIKSQQIHHKSRNRTGQQTKYRLVDLIGQHTHQLIVLKCCQNIALSISKLPKSGTKYLDEFGSIKKDNQVYVKAGIGCADLLKECFQAFQANSLKDYIFKATTVHSKGQKRVRPKSEIRPCLVGRQMRSANVELRTSSTSRHSVAPFCTSNSTRISQLEENTSKFISNRKIAQIKPQEIFTIEEIAESIQSQVKQLRQSTEGTHIHNRGLSQLETNKPRDSHSYKCPETISKLNFNSSIDLQKPQVNFCLQNKQNLKETECKRSVEPLLNVPPETVSAMTNTRKSVGKSDRKEITITDKTESNDQSFGTKMRRGLIEKQSASNNNCMSFKVAGDAQIQSYLLRVKEGKELQASAEEMSEISELSSIGSNLREELYKRDNSIKSELEDINNCLKKQEKSKEPLHRRPQLNIHQKQQMYQGTSQINYTPNNAESKPTINRPLMANLQRNAPLPSCIVKKDHLSPLRFRKKSQMVNQLVKANIIERQSNSINIL